MHQNNKVTLRDVSRKSGVSISTISRYMNSSGYVDANTAQIIQKTIDELNYKPNKFAKSLKTDMSQQIALIIPDIINPYYASIFSRIHELAAKDGYTVILQEASNNEMKNIDYVDELGVDGIIFCSIYKSSANIERLMNVGKPVVINEEYDTLIFDTLCSEYGKGIYLAAEHLIHYGHKKIGYVGGMEKSSINERRKAGFIRALQKNDLPVNQDWIFEMDFTMNAGYKAGMYFAGLDERPTAICAANDIIAMGLLMAFNEKGIKIPEDISITGEDNIEFAKICRPTLTTIDNSSIFFANNAYEMLMDRIKKKYDGEPRKVICPRSLIVRESTKKIDE